MCDPVTAGLVMFGGGAALGGYGAFKQQKAQNEANEYNAKLMERNSAVASQQAKLAEEQGEMDSKRHRLKVSQMKGSGRASFGASGALVDEGSAFDVIEETAKFGELDALTIKRNAAAGAWGYRAQSGQYVGQANLARSLRKSPWEAAGFSLLGSAQQAGGMMVAAG